MPLQIHHFATSRKTELSNPSKYVTFQQMVSKNRDRTTSVKVCPVTESHPHAALLGVIFSFFLNLNFLRSVSRLPVPGGYVHRTARIICFSASSSFYMQCNMIVWILRRNSDDGSLCPLPKYHNCCSHILLQVCFRIYSHKLCTKPI